MAFLTFFLVIIFFSWLRVCIGFGLVGWLYRAFGRCKVLEVTVLRLKNIFVDVVFLVYNLL